MTATQAIVQPDILLAHNTIHVVAALQSQLTALQEKVSGYYADEILLRGDKIMMREYCGYFGIEPTGKNI